MWNAGLGETKSEIKIARRNINNLRYADDTTLMAESEEELKSLLMKVKEESKKAGIKLNIQKTKVMASDPITSWQIDGEPMETCESAALNMPANLENSAVATGLEKVSFHSNSNSIVSRSVQSLSCARLLATPWTAAYQAPPSMGFSRQEYWSGVPLPSPAESIRGSKKPLDESERGE